MTETHFGATK